MRQTILTCDRCGCTTDNLITMVVGVTDATYIPGYGSINLSHSKSVEWCRDCIAASGVLGWVPQPKPPEGHPEPTTSERLEELIREIAREETA